MGLHGMTRRHLSEEEKNSKPKIDGALLKRMFGYLLPYWKKLLLVALTITVSALLGLLPSILTGRIIDEGLIGKDFNMLLILLAASLGVMIISNLVSIAETYINAWVAQNITYDMRNQMYKHLQNMSHRFYSVNKQGDIITRMTSDISGMQRVISDTMSRIFSAVAVIATTVFAMYGKNPILATVGIVIVPMLALFSRNVGNKLYEIASLSQKKSDDMNQILNETLSVSGQLLVKLFTAEKREYDKYDKLNKEIASLSVKESMAGSWFHFSMALFTGSGPMLIYLFGGILILKYGNTSLSVGDITVMVALLNRLYRPVDTLFNIQVDVVRSTAMFSRIFEYFDMEPEIKNDARPVVLKNVQGHLSYDHVDFSYDKDNDILHDINLDIVPKTCIAVVGPSGSGKSTLTNLIPRLYDVSEGSITLDGINIKKLELSFLRGLVGMVTQDTYLFNGTIKDNLLYAKPEATDEEIREACRKANIDGFISSLPEGYDSLVGNRGIKLSGGEKQRLSIARVILKDPKILIFDEATSSLDSINESSIQDAIEPLLKDRTSIVIAHRLSTVMAADEIYVLNKGVITQHGTHESLLKEGGIYKELYETQFEKALMK